MNAPTGLYAALWPWSWLSL